MEKEVHWIVYLLMLVTVIAIFFLLSSYDGGVKEPAEEVVMPKTVSENADVSLTILDRDGNTTAIGQEP